MNVNIYTCTLLCDSTIGMHSAATHTQYRPHIFIYIKNKLYIPIHALFIYALALIKLLIKIYRHAHSLLPTQFLTIHNKSKP